MFERHKIGAIAALAEAATFVFGFAMAATVLSDYTMGDPTPAESVAFVADNEGALYIWQFVILIVFGIALVPLVFALHERLQHALGETLKPVTAFGVIWAGLVLASGMIAIVGIGTVNDLYDTSPARAEPVWSAIDAVQNALGGGIEIVGGLWVLLVSGVSRRARALPRSLCWLGIVAGAAGIVTAVPSAEAAGALFGLGLIVWFAWLGLVMLRSDTVPAVGQSDGASPRAAVTMRRAGARADNAATS